MNCPQTAAAAAPLGPHPRATESETLVNSILYIYIFFLTSLLGDSDAHLSLRTTGPAQWLHILK